MLDFGFYNMDCMKGMKQFPDKYFELAIVDPPYFGVKKGGYMQNNGSTTKMAKEKEYHNAIWQQEKPNQEYFNELFRVSKNQIIWGANYYVSMINKDSPGWIIWDKRHQEGNPFSDCEIAYSSFEKGARIFRYLWDGMRQEHQHNREYRIHPTQKPVDLYLWILNNYSKEGDKILDTHVGSASSLIACHRTNHKYVGFEIDSVYYKEAERRLKQETAQMTIFDFMKEGVSKNGK